MTVVIAGGGAVGSQLARGLIEENHDVVVIERDATTVQRLSSSLDCFVLAGEAGNLASLTEAGISRADVFVAATDSDEANMIACAVVASQFSVGVKIARVRNMDYTTARVAENRFMGIDYLVNPEVEAARSILRSIAHGATSDVMLFEHAAIQIRNLPVDQHSPFTGMSLQRLSNSMPGAFLVAAIIRGTEYLIPSGNTVIQEGDILYLVGTEEVLEDVFSRAGRQRLELKRVVIVGGGRVGQQILDTLAGSQETGLAGRVAALFGKRQKRSIKVLDRNRERCKLLADRYPDALVIHADVSTDSVLEQEHLTRSDLVVAVTDNQELNVITALYAKALGTRRVVALVNRAQYADVATQLGVDVAVSQKNALVSTMIRFIRGETITSMHSLSDGMVEVLEVEVQPDSKGAGQRIRELGMPRDTLILAQVRDGETAVPGGDAVVQSADKLVVLARKEHVPRVQALFRT